MHSITLDVLVELDLYMGGQLWVTFEPGYHGGDESFCIMLSSGTKGVSPHVSTGINKQTWQCVS